MQEQLIKSAKELLADGTVQKVVGWQKGLFDEDVTPAVFASAEELDKGFAHLRRSHYFGHSCSF